MSRTAVIAVNPQADFLPGGALGSPGSDGILVPLQETEGDIYVVARRVYQPQHDFGLNPKNCIKGSKGAKVVRPFEEIADYIVTKDGISAFEGGTLRPLQSLEDILKEEKISRVYIGGYFLETDVAQTAFDSNALGFDTTVYSNISARSTSSHYSHGNIQQRFERAGVKFL